MDDQSPIEVEHDMSFSTNTRINYCLWSCNMASIQGNVLELYSHLKNLYKEIYATSTESEIIQHNDYKNKIDSAIEKHNKQIWNARLNDSEIPDLPREITSLMEEWELIIRKKLDKMGLTLRRSESAYNAMV